MRRAWWWAGALAGVGVIAFGALGALGDSGATRPFELAKWTVGAAVVHDALLAPLAVALGWVTARWVPTNWRAPVRVALALSGVVAALAWPYLRGYGRRASNPSALPLHYGRNVVIVVGVIWLSIAAVTVASRIVRRRSA